MVVFNRQWRLHWYPICFIFYVKVVQWATVIKTITYKPKRQHVKPLETVVIYFGMQPLCLSNVHTLTSCHGCQAENLSSILI